MYNLIQSIVVVSSIFLSDSFFYRFEPVHITDKNTIYYKNQQSTVLFALSSFQYIQLSVVFSGGVPYRQPFYKNGLFDMIYALYDYLV